MWYDGKVNSQEAYQASLQSNGTKLTIFNKEDLDAVRKEQEQNAKNL
jgi:hypothetical protein